MIEPIERHHTFHDLTVPVNAVYKLFTQKIHTINKMKRHLFPCEKEIQKLLCFICFACLIRFTRERGTFCIFPLTT